MKPNAPASVATASQEPEIPGWAVLLAGVLGLLVGGGGALFGASKGIQLRDEKIAELEKRITELKAKPKSEPKPKEDGLPRRATNFPRGAAVPPPPASGFRQEATRPGLPDAEPAPPPFPQPDPLPLPAPIAADPIPAPPEPAGYCCYAPAQQGGFIEERKTVAEALPQLPIKLMMSTKTPDRATFTLNPQVNQDKLIGDGLEQLTDYFEFALPAGRIVSVTAAGAGQLRRQGEGWLVHKPARLNVR